MLQKSDLAFVCCGRPITHQELEPCLGYFKHCFNYWRKTLDYPLEVRTLFKIIQQQHIIF